MNFDDGKKKLANGKYLSPTWIFCCPNTSRSVQQSTSSVHHLSFVGDRWVLIIPAIPDNLNYFHAFYDSKVNCANSSFPSYEKKLCSALVLYAYGQRKSEVRVVNSGRIHNYWRYDWLISIIVCWVSERLYNTCTHTAPPFCSSWNTRLSKFEEWKDQYYYFY